mmetsp:Transcript_74424/g.210235  ORF Transcript_74424/g.210235 Transcript_74424/m.210235 type:complete len:327 (-) Transcript_74424:442-1422(-)
MRILLRAHGHRDHVEVARSTLDGTLHEGGGHNIEDGEENERVENGEQPDPELVDLAERLDGDPPAQAVGDAQEEGEHGGAQRPPIFAHRAVAVDVAGDAEVVEHSMREDDPEEVQYHGQEHERPDQRFHRATERTHQVVQRVHVAYDPGDTQDAEDAHQAHEPHDAEVTEAHPRRVVEELENRFRDGARHDHRVEEVPGPLPGPEEAAPLRAHSQEQLEDEEHGEDRVQDQEEKRGGPGPAADRVLDLQPDRDGVADDEAGEEHLEGGARRVDPAAAGAGPPRRLPRGARLTRPHRLEVSCLLPAHVLAVVRVSRMEEVHGGCPDG